jgi:hypothetical protein
MTQRRTPPSIKVAGAVLTGHHRARRACTVSIISSALDDHDRATTSAGRC